MTTTHLSLAQQIAQFDDTAPVEFDPEEIHTNDPHDNGGGVSALDLPAREHYLDVGPSMLRRLRGTIADPKYDGVPTSREQLFEESDGLDNEPDSEGVAVVESQFDASSKTDAQKGLYQIGNDEESESEPSHILQPPSKAEPMEDLSSTLRKTREEDLLKGRAVTRQIAVWNFVLDARIRLQKSVMATNRIPATSDFSKIVACRDSLSKMLEEATSLSDELFVLQESLLISNESIQAPSRKKRRMNEDPPDYEVDLLDACKAASALENTFHPHLLRTLSKWSSKVQAVTPSVLLPSNRNAFSKPMPHHLHKSVVQFIDETLADYDKVLGRTRVRRGKGSGGRINAVSGKDGAGEETDAGLFDDTDFYQQLLRDVIDARGNRVGGGDDWMTSQKQKKAKQVDTKASKGRKLRYEVHEKLQNFMVPVPVHGVWHEEQIDELFASLLGKGFGAVVEEGIGQKTPEW